VSQDQAKWLARSTRQHNSHASSLYLLYVIKRMFTYDDDLTFTAIATHRNQDGILSGTKDT
jgi:hypothetical protein